MCSQEKANGRYANHFKYLKGYHMQEALDLKYIDINIITIIYKCQQDTVEILKHFCLIVMH